MKFLKIFYLLFQYGISFKTIPHFSIKSTLNFKNKNTNMNYNDIETKYNLNWYVIGEKKNFKNNKLYKVKIWDNDYLVWKNNTNYYAMDNYCSHRGASLSLGKIINNNIMCPYHGYEFNHEGKLCKVPGLNFVNTTVHNQNVYEVIEKNGWVYFNTVDKILYNRFYNELKDNYNNELKDNCDENINNYNNDSNKKIKDIYEEPESFDDNFRSIFINLNFNTYGRIVSENSLDVMHIGFVHTFGNSENPAPIYENPPYLVGDYPYHYKTEYYYESGKDSIARKVFGIKRLTIENEFILPHTTIARVIFGNFTSTVITTTLPINNTSSNLYVKTYRNFWNNDNLFYGGIIKYFGDIATTIMMKNTVMQDKDIIENIKLSNMDGKYNMKYDKLQNVYRSLYKQLIKNITFL